MEVIYGENVDIKSIFYDKESDLKSCFVEITDSCNFRCSHCYIPHQHRKMISFSMFKRVIDQLAELGCQNLLITGGEPFIHPDFCEMYSYAYNKIKFISINTNMSLLNDNILNLFLTKKPYSIEVSLYGYDEKSYYEFTNVCNMYEKVLNNIEIIKKNDIPILLKIPLTTLSIKYIDEIIEFANSRCLFLKFDYVIFPQLDHLTERCNNTRLMPKQIINFLSKNIVTINFCYNAVKKRNSDWNENLFSCIAGKEAIYIDSYGYIKMCMVTDRMELNINNNKIKDALLVFSKQRDNLKFDTSNVCKNCDKKNICRYCPGRFKLEMGDYQKHPSWYCNVANTIINYDWCKRFYVYADKVTVNNYVKDMFNIIKENQNGTDEDYEVWKENNIDNWKYKMILCIYNNRVIGYLEYYEEKDYYYWCEVQIDKNYQGDKKTLVGLYNEFININNEKKSIRGRINNDHSVDVHKHIGFKNEKDNFYIISYDNLKKWVSMHNNID